MATKYYLCFNGLSVWEYYKNNIVFMYTFLLLTKNGLVRGPKEVDIHKYNVGSTAIQNTKIFHVYEQ